MAVMNREDMELIRDVEAILAKDFREELKKIKNAGSFASGQVKTVTDATCAMLKMKELEEWLEDNGVSEYSQRNYARSYGNEYSGSRGRSSVTGRFTSYGMNTPDPYSMNHIGPYYGNDSYEMGRSGHSTRDRMIAALEDVMGEVKNDYEAKMVRDAIMNIQSSK